MTPNENQIYYLKSEIEREKFKIERIQSGIKAMELEIREIQESEDEEDDCESF